MIPERTVVVAEIGINHNGDPALAEQLIVAAARAGADAVKLQKREPELAVPPEQWQVPRETPWGTMPYIEYKRRMELDLATLVQLQRVAKRCGIELFFSVWDMPSLQLVSKHFGPAYMKVPSAKLTDHGLVAAAAEWCGKAGSQLVLSTGMSTAEEIVDAVQVAYTGLHLGLDQGGQRDPLPLWVLHCHSAYPAPTAELNLQHVQTLQQQLVPESPGTVPIVVGYSGHEFGVSPTVWAVVLGARMVERHMTLDRTMWGTDQLASVEPLAFERMVRQIRSAEQALGDGVKVVWPSELPALQKLRGAPADG